MLKRESDEKDSNHFNMVELCDGGSGHSWYFCIRHLF